MFPRDLPVLAAARPLAMPVMPQQYVHPGMSLVQLAAIIRAYRKWSLLIAAAVALGVGVGCALWPRTYEATATLMVNFEVNDPLAGREFPIGLLGSYMSTQVELARSSEVMLEVIDRLKLTSDRKYAAGYSGDPSGLPAWVEARLKKNLLIEQGLYGSQLIHVTYTTDSPVEAAQIANTVAEVYSDQQYLRVTGPATERAKRYTEQLADLKSKVAAAEEEVTAFRQRNGLVNADARTDVDMHASQIESLKTQLATLSARLAELRPTLGPRHPQVLELESQIGTTRQALNTELQAYSNKATGELVGSKYRLELQAAQSVYARALDGYDQVLLASTGGYRNVNIVSRATPPSRASKPKVRIAIFLACLVGGVLGLTIPLCYELLHRRVRCRDDMERDHGIPVIAELGAFNAAANRLARGAA